MVKCFCHWTMALNWQLSLYILLSCSSLICPSPGKNWNASTSSWNSTLDVVPVDWGKKRAENRPRICHRDNVSQLALDHLMEVLGDTAGKRSPGILFWLCCQSDPDFEKLLEDESICGCTDGQMADRYDESMYHVFTLLHRKYFFKW